MKWRFELSQNSRAAFVELHPDYLPSVQELKVWLEGVEGVTRVGYTREKHVVGEFDNSFGEYNLLVYSAVAVLGIVFVVSRKHHRNCLGLPRTVSVLFKCAPVGYLGEAWRILLAATDGMQLLPAHVENYRTKHIAFWTT